MTYPRLVPASRIRPWTPPNGRAPIVRSPTTESSAPGEPASRAGSPSATAWAADDLGTRSFVPHSSGPGSPDRPPARWVTPLARRGGPGPRRSGRSMTVIWCAPSYSAMPCGSGLGPLPGAAQRQEERRRGSFASAEAGLLARPGQAHAMGWNERRVVILLPFKGFVRTAPGKVPEVSACPGVTGRWCGGVGEGQRQALCAAMEWARG